MMSYNFFLSPTPSILGTGRQREGNGLSEMLQRWFRGSWDNSLASYVYLKLYFRCMLLFEIGLAQLLWTYLAHKSWNRFYKNDLLWFWLQSAIFIFLYNLSWLVCYHGLYSCGTAVSIWTHTVLLWNGGMLSEWQHFCPVSGYPPACCYKGPN